MLIAVGSAKGAPGVTTLALAVAALWPRPDAVLVECDPAGGDLWARFGHHPEPGLSTLAAAALAPWHGPIPDAYRQRLAVGADVVLAIPGEGAAASVQTLADKGIGALRQAAATSTVVLDVGRLEGRSPAVALAAAADHVLLLATPGLAEQAQVATRLPWLASGLAGRLWLVRAGEGPHRGAELERDLGLPVLGTVPHSRWGAGVLAGQLGIPNWRRLKLARAVRGIAVALAALESAPSAGVMPRPAGAHPEPVAVAAAGKRRRAVPR
jgi:hypothetical protein